MASSITFDFISTGGPELSRQFKSAGDNAAAAARGAKVLSDVIKDLGQKEDRTAAESATLARALKLTGDAEDRAAAKALAAEIAISRLDESMAKSSKDAGSARGGFAGLVGEVTGFGAAADAASSGGSKFQLAMAGLNLASGVLEPAMAGVVVAVGGLAAGFAAAGAGLGVFGLVAQSVFAEATKAATAYGTAQAKYASATTSAQRTAALKAEKAAYQGLSAPVKTLAMELGDVKNKWKAFTDAAAPGVVSVISQGLGLLPKILAAMKPFLAPVETALHGIITELNTGLSSAGFKSFIDALAQNAGPAITKIATAIGNVIVGIGGILKAFLPTSQQMLTGIDKITAKFREWGTTLSGNTGFTSLMATFRTETPQAVAILKNLGEVLLNVGKAMFGLSTFSNSRLLLAALTPLSGILVSLSKNTDLVRVALYGLAAFKIGSAFSWIPGAWAGLVKFSAAAEGATAKEVIAAAATKVWAGAQAVLNAVMDANPIVLVAIAAAALGAAFYLAWQKSAAFRDVIKDIGAVMLDAGIIIVKANKIIVDSFLSMVGSVLHAAVDAFGWIPGLGSKLKTASAAFDGFKGTVDGAFDSMLGKMTNWRNDLTNSGNVSATVAAKVSGDFKKQQTAATNASGAVSTYTDAIRGNGIGSQAAATARQQLIKDMTAAGVNAHTANADVATYTAAIKANGIGSQAAATARQQLIKDILGASANAKTGQTDLANYTQMIKNNQTSSDAGKAARAKLITDLTNAGLSAKAAAGLVDGLRTSVSKLTGKTVTIIATASGTGQIAITGSGWAFGQGNVRFHAAQGAYINRGTGPTADDVLIRASKGELVVPTHMVRAGAVDHLRGSIPGFAAGGFVGLGNSIAAAGPAAGQVTGGLAGKAVSAFIAATMAAIKAEVAKAAAKAAAAKAAANAVPGGQGGPASASAAQAQAYAKSRLGAYGWAAGQMGPLISLWNQESGWNRLARNPSSGAYGIPQALPASKMGAAANPPTSSAAAQINWGLGYIKSRPGYGSPAAAWAHEVAYNWYDRGGMLPTGVSIAVNNTGRPEQVLPPARSGAASGGPGVTDRLDRLAQLLERLIGTTAAVPAATGRHVGGAIGGAAASASFRSRYPRGGA